METKPSPPPSFARKRRCPERNLDLNSFFFNEEDRPKKPRFLLMACAEEGKSFKMVSAVRLARAIEEKYGKLQAVVRQRNGTILFEALTDEQIDRIMKTKQIAGLQVEVTTHPTLNLCKGVVNHVDFSTESEEDLVAFFKSQGVTDVYRIKRREHGREIPTSTLILTFNLPTLPRNISCGFYNLRVRQYVPNPLRCFKCQRFGHTQQRCMADTPVCGNCGKPSHEPGPCTTTPHCVNCEGAHPANYNQCPTFLKERDIQKIRVVEKVSFPEAKRRFHARNPVDLSRSFSATVKAKSPRVAAGCQTERAAPQVVSFGCQVSPVDLPGDTSPLEGGRIIIPTKYKVHKKVQPAQSTKSTTKTVSTEVDVRRTPNPNIKGPSKSRPTTTFETSSERASSPPGNTQEVSVLGEAPVGEESRASGSQRRKKKES